MQLLKWSEIKERVNALLNASADQAGVQAFIHEQMRLSAIDIQNRIPAFWPHHVKAYSADDLLVDDKASVGSLPSNVIPTEFYLVDADETDSSHSKEAEHYVRGMLKPYEWRYRFDLVGGALTNRQQGYISIAPSGRDFYVFPVVTDADKLIIHYREKQTVFADDELTGFPDDVTGAIYAFVKAALLMDVDNDIASSKQFRSRTYYAPGVYETALQDLYRTYNANTSNPIVGSI